MGKLEDYAVIDKDLAKLNGDSAEFRMNEDMAHIEGINQTMAGNLFYGNELNNDASFNGFSAYYNTITGAESGKNIVDCGGTGSTNTSAWLVNWSPRDCFCIFPKGSVAGLEMEDVTGTQPITDADNGRYMAYQTRYAWTNGLALRDWRKCARAANIDVTTLGTGGAPDLLKALTQLVYKPPTMPRRVTPVQTATGTRAGDMPMWGKPVFYVNRTIHEALDLQAQEKVNLRLKYEEFDGKPVLSFRGIPIRTVDQLINTEARVV
jgi:hypothetical protein